MDKKKMILVIMLLDIMDGEISELIESAMDTDPQDPIIPLMVDLLDDMDAVYNTLHNRLV
ncbi:MAG: hypothetical protein ACI4GB_05495 [Acutalibacteraceae bacterium]